MPYGKDPSERERKRPTFHAVPHSPVIKLAATSVEKHRIMVKGNKLYWSLISAFSFTKFRVILSLEVLGDASRSSTWKYYYHWNMSKCAALMVVVTSRKCIPVSLNHSFILENVIQWCQYRIWEHKFRKGKRFNIFKPSSGGKLQSLRAYHVYYIWHTRLKMVCFSHR